MGFSPDAFGSDASPFLEETVADGPVWSPVFRHGCNFDGAVFNRVMLNLIKNPNINSSWLFRADILLNREGAEALEGVAPFENQPPLPTFKSFQCERVIVRRMIPRNAQRDQPLDQTCVLYTGTDSGRSLVIYLPHFKSEADVPFYHPAVRGIAFLHEWKEGESAGHISIHYVYFDRDNAAQKVTRTALSLLGMLYKHGEGEAKGYVKRVQHDVLVPQPILQDRYAKLKQKYARTLVDNWMESTDPGKHVFEDLCIAAFLIELWNDMYKDSKFPGFVDIGCGNGLLVYILNQEGYTGWGFDARARKSWDTYNTKASTSEFAGVQDSLQQLILLPSIAMKGDSDTRDIATDRIHNGHFPKGTFIVSNHADELTPWTPILGALSDCPFIMIPCCSHDLTGAKFRAPPPKGKTAPKSTYYSLMTWVSDIAADCGWEVEKEMLRIPSTRNAAVIGRRRTADSSSIDFQAVVNRYGGTEGYFDNVVKLLKSNPRGH
ncbi:putative trna (uracil-o -)-methyltransferase protein [Phaeoacremonium minimum UCRPA7]|uniref:tRNA (uracil-O(2)-)-methyltransferase n=1 Tax=Phaeoacremonium minimum (strain UCR-PA7) TaxID=1286976 RepID=R8BI36_PHAM7|nr:putative trna (uracil-o -)-methyltransferase protein [Phaeoacremonium minimum UCRPA7]EON98971.1 putative trna (uracil-o -)-methyltransferase protein [Phaeoacremonium minimum UCRPA7]